MSKVVRKLPQRAASPSSDVEAFARAKIKTLDELVDISAQAKASGQRVVLAHGTFDLLHMGHVRHLEQARTQGDVLIVTITGDGFVNKGPGRPVFTSMLRAEMLAAVGYVDWVAINEAPTAENVIAALKPDVYAKGADYAEAENDKTGKIADERSSVEGRGGRIFFTDDITFSSSSLLNRFFDIHDPKLRGYLEQQRQRNITDTLLEMIEKVRDYRVLLVGDAIIDEYHYVSPLGKSPKENLIATLYRDKELFAGGVVAAANHVAAFCREVDVLTCLGEEDSYEDLILAATKPNVKLNALRRPGVPTTRKSRFVDADYLRKLFEVYYMDDSYIAGHLEQEFAQAIRERAGDYDLVIVTDFGHGLITRSGIEALTSSAKFLAVNAQSNSANQGYNLVTKYPWADYICIDAPEAKLAVGDKFCDLGLIASKLLPEQIACDRMILTHGRYGCVTYDRPQRCSSHSRLYRAGVGHHGRRRCFSGGDLAAGCQRRQPRTGRLYRKRGRRHEGGHRRPQAIGRESAIDPISANALEIGGPMDGQIEGYFATLGALGNDLKASDATGTPLSLSTALEWSIARTQDTKSNGAKILFVGNGGSAAIASHMAIDYTRNGGFSALAFNDGAALTCFSNDLGYEQVFAQQVELHGRAGDLLVAISSSGNSANIVNAVEAARTGGVDVLTLSGFAPDNRLRGLGDVNIYVPNSLYGFVEIAHLAVCHAILDIAMGWRAEGASPVYTELKRQRA